MNDHLFKVLLNEKKTEYVYQQVKDRRNISCSQVIAEAVYKQMPKKPEWLEVEGKFYSQCGMCSEWFGSNIPNYCPCCGHAVDKG